jgi:hypothetical protein
MHPRLNAAYCPRRLVGLHWHLPGIGGLEILRGIPRAAERKRRFLTNAAPSGDGFNRIGGMPRFVRPMGEESGRGLSTSVLVKNHGLFFAVEEHFLAKNFLGERLSSSEENPL